MPHRNAYMTDELQAIYDCWFALRTGARIEGEDDRLNASNCRSLHYDLITSCGVDLFLDGETSE